MLTKLISSLSILSIVRCDLNADEFDAEQSLNADEFDAEQSLNADELQSEFNAWEILQADFTCCPQHTTSSTCLDEGGSECIWVPDSSDSVAHEVSAADGHDCLGLSYIKCKEIKGIDGCCHPDCEGSSSGAGSGGSTGGAPAPPVVCFAKPPTAPTLEPTPSPVAPKCEEGVNYAVEGVPCQISGDPHFKMFNGVKHDFMGQPDTITAGADGDYQDQFYYVTNCDGSDVTDMPFRIMGTHYVWPKTQMTAVDYLTIELYGDDGHVFNVYLSHSIHSYATAGDDGVSTRYDDTDSDKLKDLINNIAEPIGGRFEVTFSREDVEGNKVSLQIKIDHNDDNLDNDAIITIRMTAQMDAIDGRKRMHYIYIHQHNLFKCHSCGLCGNFKDMATASAPHDFETCDGEYVEIRPGYDANKVPEAYDISGWTYERNFYLNRCGETYDITDNKEGLVYVEPCDSNIADDVAAACAAKVADEAICCEETLGGAVCGDLQEDCNFDACVIATDRGGSTDDIEVAVQETLGAAIYTACHVPGAGDAFDEGNLVNYKYLGCFKDKRGATDITERAMQYSANMHITDQNIAECVDLCTKAGFKLMALQYGKECWCSQLKTASHEDQKKALDDAKRYGEIKDNPGTPDKDESAQCGKYTPEYGAEPGCWGGDWIMCLYELNAAPAPPKEYMSRINAYGDGQIQGEEEHMFAVESSVLIENSELLQNGYVQMGIIGAIVVFIGGSYYYYIHHMKEGKYIPIKDVSLV